MASGQLAFFAQDTGFYKDGYCRTGSDDTNNTSVAALLTEDFLNSQGSSLKSQGLKPGSKSCLTTKLWKSAFDAAQRGDAAKSSVPQVHLHATHEDALKDISYKDLKQFEAPREVGGRARGRQDGHDDPKSGGGVAGEANDLGGDYGSTGPKRDVHDKKTEGA